MKILTLVLILCGGVFAAPPDQRIIGGNNAVLGEYPYQISLQLCTAVCVHICGGAILTENWVITAGHCITDITAEGVFSVLAGVVDLNDVSYGRQMVSVTHGFIHPDYKGGANPHDLALFQLSAPLIFNRRVAAVKLPEPGAEIFGLSRFSGWGATGAVLDTPIMPNTLQAIEVPIIAIEDCSDILDAVLSGSQHPLDLDGNICTGPTNGAVAACIGDSGNPLVQQGTLVGLVSWAINPCGTNGAPSSVYTKISHYMHWIRSEVDNLP